MDLVSGARFAEMGIDVTCIDIDRSKIDRLAGGEIPIYEPGLEEMVKRNVEAGRLHFTTSLPETLPKVEVVFSAVGTPPDEDGSADLQYAPTWRVSSDATSADTRCFVTKSTVPVGTAAKVREAISEELARRGADVPFDVASNPEFLKEGAAIKDFTVPRPRGGRHRKRTGAKGDGTPLPSFRGGQRPYDIHRHTVGRDDKVRGQLLLATRISFMNDIANLCELVGADVNMVRKGIGSDTRIGKKFLYAGCGYGGSCFPKDVKALIKSAEQAGYDMRVLRAVEEVNAARKEVLFKNCSGTSEAR